MFFKMFLLRAALLGTTGLFVFGYPTGESVELNIVNGDTAEPNSLPFQVYLKFEDSLEQWDCGGSVISQNYVLTTGYCTLDRDGTDKKVTVYLGAHNVTRAEEETRIEVESTEIITHESLKNRQRGTGNIGLVKLPKPVTFTPAIQPIGLGTRQQANNSLVNVTGQISGWGSTEGMVSTQPDVLHVADIMIVKKARCKDVTVFDENSQICGTHRNNSLSSICDRDVGGPLIVDDTQVGIIFYSDLICDTNAPQIFINVSYYFDWIEQHSDVVIN